MQRLSEILEILGGMPFEVLVAVVILAGFGLAAYAIFTVVIVTRGGANDVEEVGTIAISLDRERRTQEPAMGSGGPGCGQHRGPDGACGHRTYGR